MAELEPLATTVAEGAAGPAPPAARTKWLLS